MRALVMEGGGMRAAYTNGVLAAFEDRGVGFDAVYGTSAGGALAAWFSAGQARFALETWPFASDRRILSYRRWLRGGPLLDHDALYRIVYEKERPLDVRAVRRARHPVVVTATDADTGEARYQDLRHGPVLDWLRATGRLPMATNPPVLIDGRRWLDGGIIDPVPIGRAIDDGFRDIVLVLTRAWIARKPESWWLCELIARRYPALRDAVFAHHALHNDAIRLADDPPSGVRIRILRPSTDTRVGRLTRDMRRITAAIEQGRLDGAAFADGIGRDG
ncbi:MAG: patatin-like phospholipase family protein [Methanobacteriota archaeon]